MTQAQAAPPKPRSRIIRRERPIIERPRLIRKLDACEARTILLLAPAGYGKTTLARQWAKTLSRVVWVSLTSAHRDVTVLARDLARSIEDLGDEGFVDFMDQYLSARQNPQREAREIGLVLAEALNRARVQWIVFDDYHELAADGEADNLITLLRSESGPRFLVASRTRTAWATARSNIYGDVDELTQNELAMDRAESAAVVGRHGPTEDLLIAKAHGWPAILAIVSNLEVADVPRHVLPERLHRYLTEELISSLPPTVRNALDTLALLPVDLIRHDRAEIASVLRDSTDIGILIPGDEPALHPLVQDFLLCELQPDDSRINDAIQRCRLSHHWERAFDLALRFDRLAAAEEMLKEAYRPLVRSGRLWTLSDFASQLRAKSAAPLSVVDVIDAEIALRDGDFVLAGKISQLVAERLEGDDVLRSTAALIEGKAKTMCGDIAGATRACAIARESAFDDRDAADAMFFEANAAAEAGAPGRGKIVEKLQQRRSVAPTDYLRYGCLSIVHGRLGGGLRWVNDVSEYLRVMEHVPDPRTRTGFLAEASYAFALKGEYETASRLTELLVQETERYNLDFVRPHYHWRLAQISVGTRRFGEAGRHLNAVESHASRRDSGFHALNARVLRARIALALGRADDALAFVVADRDDLAVPSMCAEVLSTRAICYAALARPTESREVARRALEMTTSVEILVQTRIAEALLAVNGGQEEAIRDLANTALETDVWDPVLCVLRSNPTLASTLAENPDLQLRLERLYGESRDHALARRSRLRVPTTSRRLGTLSPREHEILGLMAEGYKTADIAGALFISQSTVKVHVRHIFEKLGVRTRAEAVNRLSAL